METNVTLTPGQIPPSYALCFREECPKAAACARFFAGQHIPEDRISGPAVYPTAGLGDACACYRQKRVIRAAYGFNALFSEVKQKDSASLRLSIKRYLGGNTTYYRYHHGERLLSPEQQEWIIRLFQRRGYTEGLYFDAYRELYDFTL